MILTGCVTNPLEPEPTITKQEIIMEITASGAWSGLLAVGDSSQSINGSGNKSYVYNKSDDWYYLSAQKSTADSSRLHVAIYRRVTLSDGKINTICESSAETTVEYGVATASQGY